MMELDGRTAVVTGGGSGIGRGISLGLAAEGMKVAVLDVNGEAAERVAQEIAATGASALAITVDVTSSEQLTASAAKVGSHFGHVNLLCANAGVILPIGPLAEKSDSDWDYVFSVNVHGVVKTVAAFLPSLRSAGEAHIVTTASLGGVLSVPEVLVGVYTSSKYAVVGYSECLRGELAEEGIGVSVLCPGMVKSDLYRTSAENRPVHLGRPDTIGDVSIAPSIDTSISDALAPTSMAAEDVGPIVVRGVRENRLHIFTHPEALTVVEARFAGMREDFKAEEDAQRR
jgi:NAD(P)-dependent dehydrogenase (short-subunit alcohol dehydrogenase family)